jgi:hypothetical protein
MNRKKGLGLLVLTAATVVFSALVLLGPSAKAADNPCDPPHSLITYCKTRHGHFDTSCCCCVGAH